MLSQRRSLGDSAVKKYKNKSIHARFLFHSHHKIYPSTM
jgi:hypothetical protein